MAIRIELPNGTMLEVNTEDEEVARATADDYIQKNPKFNDPDYDAVSDGANTAKSEKKPFDIGTATFKEIQEEANKRRGGKPVSPEDAKIDYKTGIKDAGIRYNLAKKETIEEKKAYLNDVYGEENVRQDSKGELIVRQDGKEIAIDEEGFSRYDFVDFAGQGGLALPVAIGASILTGGASLLVSVPLVAGVSYGAKILDEYWETQQGYQRQTDDEIQRDAIYEGLFAGGGEIVGRGLSRAFGLLIKSRGPQRIGEESADQARSRIAQIVKDGGRPTIDEATGAPILGRLQAIYEGVFPNRGAAKANASYVINQMNKVKGNLNLTDDTIEGLKKELNDEIAKQFDDPIQNMTKLEKEVETMIGEQTQRVIKAIRGGADDVEMRDAISLAYKSFQNHNDLMYGAANKLLKDEKLIDVSDVLDTLGRVDKQFLGIGFSQSKWAKAINSLQETNEAMNLIPSKITVEEANSLRAALNAAGYDPTLVGGQNQAALSQIKSSLDEAFKAAEIKAVASGNADAAKGFRMIDEANKFYTKNVDKFKETSAAKLIQNIKTVDGLNPIKDMQLIIKNNEPGSLKEFLQATNAIKGRVADNKYINKELQKRMKEVQSFKPDDPTRLAVEAEYKSAQNLAINVNKAIDAGENTTDAIRRNLGQTWFENVVKNATNSFGKVNGIEVESAIRKLGTTKNVLFKPNELKEVNDFARQILSTGDNVDINIINQLADEGLPISKSVQRLKQMTAEADLIKKDKFLNTIQTKILEDPDSVVDYVFRNGRSEDIYKLKSTIKNSQSLDTIEQIAMQKILSSAGDPGGANFIKIVKSGSGAKALQSKLDKIGTESLTAMFGKERTDLLFKLAKNMALVSDQSLAGKGGLAPASIAIGLSLAAIIANPVAGLSTAGSFFVMSKLLRSKTFLKIATSPRAPGDDKLGLAFQESYEAIAQFGGETIQRGQEETRETIKEVASSAPVQQAISQAPEINIDDKLKGIFNSATRGNISPILVPNQSTRATVGSQ